MDTSKVSLGEMIAAASAFALFIFMFLPWYGVDSVGGIGVGGLGADINAWEAFSFVDILLLLVVVAVVGLVVATAAGSAPELPAPVGQIIAIAGGIALLLILIRLIFPPGVDTAGVDIDVDLGRKIGAFLGLLAAAGIAYGGWRAMNEAAPLGGGPGAPPPAGTETPSSSPLGGTAPPATERPASAPGEEQPPPAGEPPHQGGTQQ